MAATWHGLEVGPWSSWAGSVLSALSVILAFWIVLRDRRTTEHTRVAGVRAWFSTDMNGLIRQQAGILRIHLANESPFMIYEPRLVVTRKRTLRRDRKWDDFTDAQGNVAHIHAMQPKQEGISEAEVEADVSKYQVRVIFRDRSRRKWRIDVVTGKLKPVRF